MTERIDHAAEARRALAAAAETPADVEGADPWLLAAQVHATLALVEQQRIANIIAMVAGSDPDATSMLYQRDEDLWNAPSELNPQIREALGL